VSPWLKMKFFRWGEVESWNGSGCLQIDWLDFLPIRGFLSYTSEGGWKLDILFLRRFCTSGLQSRLLVSRNAAAIGAL